MSFSYWRKYAIPMVLAFFISCGLGISFGAVDSKIVQDLSNNMWKCIKLEGTKNNPSDDLGTKEGYFKKNFDDSKWADQFVPWNWDRKYPPEKYIVHGLNDIKGKFFDEGGIGWYRKKFTVNQNIPKDFRIILHFGAVDTECTVYLNGEKIGEHQGYITPFEFDVTDKISRKKENILAVRVYDMHFNPKEAGKMLPGMDGLMYMTTSGGITEPVVLIGRPQIYVKRLKIDTHISPASIDVETFIENTNNGNKKIQAIYKVFPVKGTTGETASGSIEIPVEISSGTNSSRAKIDISNPILWRPDNPYLYKLQIVLFENGKEEEVYSERFGLREIKTQGRDLLLNGKKLRLFGTEYVLPRNDMEREWADMLQNEGDFMRRSLLLFKKMNFNIIRSHDIYPPVFYEICDEIGLMVYAEYGWNNIYKPKQDYFLSKVIPQMTEWIQRDYNHPSIILWCLGNENNIDAVPLMTKIYDYIKTLDISRPISSSSGGEHESAALKSDFVDTHSYRGGAFEEPWPFVSEILYNDLKETEKAHNGLQRPFLNTEYGWSEGDWLQWDSDKPRIVLDSEKQTGKITNINMLVRRDNYKEIAQEMAKNGIRMGEVRHMGLQTVLVPRTKSYARAIEWKRLEEKLRSCDFLTGQINFVGGRTLMTGSVPMYPLKGYPFAWRPVNEVLRIVCQPILPFLKDFQSGLFAGRKEPFNFYLANDSEDDLGPTILMLSLIDKDKKEYFAGTINCLGIKQGTKIEVPYIFNVPNVPTGSYKLNITLKSGEKQISENYYDFFILGKASIPASLTGTAKVALYDTLGKTKNILDSLKVKYTLVTSFNNLSSFDTLIIGYSSLDDKIKDSAIKIRKWIENGGKVVSFEQYRNLFRDWVPRLVLLGREGETPQYNVFADVVDFSHPIFKGLSRENFNFWDNEHGLVSKTLLSPLRESILAGGGEMVTGLSSSMQMSICEEEMEKGKVLLNQLEVTSAWQKDPSATLYMINLVKYALTKDKPKEIKKTETAEIAKQTEQMPSVRISVPDDASMPIDRFIDIESVNKNFITKESKDINLDIVLKSIPSVIYLSLTRPITKNEANNILQWIRQGGNLIIKANKDDISNQLNNLLSQVGITISTDGYISLPTAVFEPKIFRADEQKYLNSPVTDGVKEITLMDEMGYWTVKTSTLTNAKPLASLIYQTKEMPFVITKDEGNGKIIFFNILTDRPKMFDIDGLNQPGKDNRKLITQLFDEIYKNVKPIEPLVSDDCRLSYEDGKLSIANKLIEVTIIPSAGGRIMEFLYSPLEFQNQLNASDPNGHGGFYELFNSEGWPGKWWNKPYELKILKKESAEVEVSLSYNNDGKIVTRYLTIKKDNATIFYKVNIKNETQSLWQDQYCTHPETKVGGDDDKNDIISVSTGEGQSEIVPLSTINKNSEKKWTHTSTYYGAVDSFKKVAFVHYFPQNSPMPRLWHGNGTYNLEEIFPKFSLEPGQDITYNFEWSILNGLKSLLYFDKSIGYDISIEKSKIKNKIPVTIYISSSKNNKFSGKLVLEVIDKAGKKLSEKIGMIQMDLPNNKAVKKSVSLDAAPGSASISASFYRDETLVFKKLLPIE